MIQKNPIENNRPTKKKQIDIKNKDTLPLNQDIAVKRVKPNLQKKSPTWVVHHEEEACLSVSLNLLGLVTIYVLLLVHVRLTGHSNIGKGHKFLYDIKNSGGEVVVIN
eukprot:snap_masked-scaffold_12-processed-gene-12.24-mRNA-1 protein AED:1.00 eAED:1.00 QI:0/0/0/0/1/1/2/0/107